MNQKSSYAAAAVYTSDKRCASCVRHVERTKNIAGHARISVRPHTFVAQPLTSKRLVTAPARLVHERFAVTADGGCTVPSVQRHGGAPSHAMRMT